MEINRRNFISPAVIGGPGSTTLPILSCKSETISSDSPLDINSRYAKLDEIRSIIRKCCHVPDNPGMVSKLECLLNGKATLHFSDPKPEINSVPDPTFRGTKELPAILLRHLRLPDNNKIENKLENKR